MENMLFFFLLFSYVSLTIKENNLKQLKQNKTTATKKKTLFNERVFSFGEMRVFLNEIINYNYFIKTKKSN